MKKTIGENNPPAIDLAPSIKCPVIGFFGNEDQNPSPEDVNDYCRALTDAGVEHEFHRYDYVGHAFQSFNIEEKYSEDAWTKVLDFFRKKFEDSLIFRIKRGGGTWGWVHVTILSHLLAKKGISEESQRNED